MANTHTKTLSNSELASIIGDDFQSEDLQVFVQQEAFLEIPITTPFKSKGYCILIVLSGEVTLQANLFKHTLKENDSISLKSNAVVQILSISNDFKITALSFSNNFIFSNLTSKPNIDAFDFFTNDQNQIFTIPAEKTPFFVSLFEILKEYNTQKEDSLFKNEIISNTFSLMVHTYGELFKKKHPKIKFELSRQEELVVRFWNILEENIKTERSVQFYADILNVSPGHLYKVLKEVTGKTTSQLIDDALILEARILLEKPQLSIAQVSDELQFSDQSFFGKHFKKSTGLSPTAYRASKAN